MTLWIRTEASSTIGLGHFMRCFAIAEQARRDSHKVTFILNEASDAVVRRVDSIGARLNLIQSQIGKPADIVAVKTLVAGRPSGDWLIIDGYKATADYIAQLSGHTRVLVMDDLAGLHHIRADIVVNAASAAKDLAYDDIAPQSVVLKGPRYAPIRAEFTRQPDGIEVKPFIAVMFGGSDPQNLTGQALEHLYHELPAALGYRLPIRLIAGPANPHAESLLAQVTDMHDVTVFVAPDSVADTLSGAQLVITAGGGSVGEIAAMGLMALVLIVVDNQVMSLKSAPYPVMDARQGLPDDFTQWVATFIAHPEICQDTALRAQTLIDGRGPKRILEIMNEMSA